MKFNMVIWGSYTFDDVASLAGAAYIKTANDDKDGSPNNSITFDVNMDVAVYVAHDDRITSKPSWLGSFTDTGDDLVSSSPDHEHLSLYRKIFPAGTVNLYENGGSQPDCSMYSVVVVPSEE